MYDKVIKEIAVINGIGFKHMTNYRAELIHMRNEGATYNDIAIRINNLSKEVKINRAVVEKWFARETQPKDEIIEILEEWLQTRLFSKVTELRKPNFCKK